MAGKLLDEALGVAVISNSCVNDLKGRLELASKDMKRAEVREETLGFIERSRDSLGRPRPIEVDNKDTEYPDAHAYLWGGAAGYWTDGMWSYCSEEDELRDENSPHMSQMNPQMGKGGEGKEKGLASGGKKGIKKGKGKGKGKARFHGRCQ